MQSMYDGGLQGALTFILNKIIINEKKQKKNEFKRSQETNM